MFLMLCIGFLSYKSFAINEIHLSTIAQGHREFSQSQVETIAEIAYQCPIIGGNAVFLARGLYEFVNQEAVYDDEGTCAAQGEQWRHGNNKGGENIQDITLYPNPTDGECTITFANSIPHSTIRLVNSLGQVMANFDIPENSTSYHFSVRSLTEGVYFCEIMGKSKVLHRAKLVIIR